MFTGYLHAGAVRSGTDRTTMFVKELYRAGQTRKFSIKDVGGGWEVRDEQDEHVLKVVRYTDWHRVERALNTFKLQIVELEDAGWLSLVTR